MKKIDKSHQEPPCLTSYKQNQSNHDYKKFTNDARACFEDLRIALLKESGFLCCYCMQRIAIKDTDIQLEKMVVEHFKPKSIYNGQNNPTDLRLNYKNLLSACLGNKDSEAINHCDASKDDGELSIIPNPSTDEFLVFMQTLSYKIRYKQSLIDKKVFLIAPTNPDDIVNDELVGTNKGKLNLNEDNLAKKRFAVWSSVEKILDKTNWQIDEVQKMIRKYAIKQTIITNDGKIYDVYREFCQMIIFLLEEKINKIQTQFS